MMKDGKDLPDGTYEHERCGDKRLILTETTLVFLNRCQECSCSGSDRKTSTEQVTRGWERDICILLDVCTFPLVSILYLESLGPEHSYAMGKESSTQSSIHTVFVANL